MQFASRGNKIHRANSMLRTVRNVGMAPSIKSIICGDLKLLTGAKLNSSAKIYLEAMP